MKTQTHKLLLAATVVLVVSAMCLEGLLGTSLSLNAERRGDTDTFDVSASFIALDENGTEMAGASVYCSGDGSQFSSKGTTQSDGTLSFTESFALSSSDCPTKTITRSCYAQKGDAKTETVSGTVDLNCRSAETSTSTATTGGTATPAVTSTSTTTATPIPGGSASCDSSCKSSLGANGGICASDVSGPRCYEDVEAQVRSVMPTGSNGQVVSWLPSSKSSGFYCNGGSTTKCFCYTLQSCAPYGCKSGTCVSPTACQTKGVTGNAICALRGLSCVSSTCSGGCSDAPAAEDPCGCTATCSSLKAGEVCQTAGQSGSEACAAIGKSCVSSTCGSGTCPNPTRSDAGPCDCTATCK